MSDKLDNKNLLKLIASLKGKLPVAKVGIMGDKNQRKGDLGTETNVEIGIKHEFGDEDNVKRSFLREPIASNLKKYLEEAGAFGEESLKKIVDEKSLVTFVKKLGVVGEQIISDAFDTGGFGKWKPSNMNFKKNHQTLVETQQLRNSISSEVEE